MSDLDYISLNAMINLKANDGSLQLDKDKEAVRKYFLEHVNQNTVFFHDLKEKLDYLVEEEYYEAGFLSKYDFKDIKELYQLVYSYKFRFTNFVGALKFYNQYALKNFKGDRYLERFEDRVAAVALYLGDGNIENARDIAIELITNRYQPATPTFLNAGKKQRGDLISCYLLENTDDMESIARTITSSLQLSKRGGGVAINLSAFRESGAPIKKIENQSSGVIPIMKILEDSFSYANQLGARQGAGAVYLHAHHPDIMEFLDTKRENADEKVRIKTLSLGVVIPDITFHLAKENKDMYLFSPYDVEKVYGKSFPYINVTEEYENMVENPDIKKKKINARKLLQTIAELQFESGYPYIMFEDNTNQWNPIEGKITMSNLCVTGETKLLTKHGYRTMLELAHSKEDKTHVLVDTRARDKTLTPDNGEKLSLEEGTKVVKTAENAEIYRVDTSNGLHLRATAWHKMYVVRNDEVIKIPLQELIIGDKLLAQKGGLEHYAHGCSDDADLGYLLGVITANGKLSDNQVFIKSDKVNTGVLHFNLSKHGYEDDLVIEDGLISSQNLVQVFNDNFPGWGINHVTPSLLRASEKVQFSYLHGLCADNNSVYSGKINFLEDIQLMAVNCQLASVLDRENHNITIDPDSNDDYTIVTSIVSDGIEDVYDLTVPNGNSVIFNGIATGQCSEILQVQKPSIYNEDGSYKEVGLDISCNLGSLNIAKVMDGGNLDKTVDIAMRTLTKVSEMSDINSVPSIDKKNKLTRAVGLGQMNLHGFLAREHIHYDSPETIEFVSAYFAAVNYYSIKSSNAQAVEKNEIFANFENSDYASGKYFDQYLNTDFNPKSDKIKALFDKFGIILPTVSDWSKLKQTVMSTGLINEVRLAVAPTGSISYVNHSTSSIHPIVAANGIEVRKEGILGRVYVPSPYLNEETMPYYRDAYDIGYEPLINVYAAATPHIDQGLSCTLFFKSDVTTRDVNKAQLLAWRKKLKTLYYVRIRADALAGTEIDNCVSCTI